MLSLPTRLLLALTALAPLPAQDVDAPAGFVELRREAMGTTFAVRCARPDANARAAVEAAFDEVVRLDAMLSTWRDDSVVSELASSAHERAVPLDLEFRSILERCLGLSAATDGAFDVTVGPLVEAWGFARGEARVLGETELEELRARVGWQHLALEDGGLRFERPGMALDFGAVGKGVAVDAMVAVLRAHGVTPALVHGGTSTVFALGAPPCAADGWTVRIRDPRGRDVAPETVVLRDASLSVSGDYERFVEIDGERHTHVIDPRSGRPVRGVQASLAIARDATTSDALSTAFFVLGESGTGRFVVRRPEVRAMLWVDGDAPESTRVVRLPGVPSAASIPDDSSPETDDDPHGPP